MNRHHGEFGLPLRDVSMSKITKTAGVIFFGGWCLLGTIFYIKAIIDFLT